MKLYTEEISIEFAKWTTKFCYHLSFDIWISRENSKTRLKSNELFEQFLKEKEFKPIELPSDEDIENKTDITFEQDDSVGKYIFGAGAKWMKEQILKQNNK